jgi:prefoldin subunit 5
MEKIDALEAEIQSLRAELARLHEQQATPSPAKRVRAMR